MSVYNETLKVLNMLSTQLITQHISVDKTLYPIVFLSEVAELLNISPFTLKGRLRILANEGVLFKDGSASIHGYHYGYSLWITDSNIGFFLSLRKASIPERPTHPCVYLFKCHKFFKIGYTSKHPVERLAQINHANPYPVTLSFYAELPNAAEVELHLHKQYQHRNVKGEWFLLTPQEQTEIIETLNSYEVES